MPSALVLPDDEVSALEQFLKSHKAHPDREQLCMKNEMVTSSSGPDLCYLAWDLLPPTEGADGGVKDSTNGTHPLFPGTVSPKCHPQPFSGGFQNSGGDRCAAKYNSQTRKSGDTGTRSAGRWRYRTRNPARPVRPQVCAVTKLNCPRLWRHGGKGTSESFASD